MIDFHIRKLNSKYIEIEVTGEQLLLKEEVANFE